MDACPYIIILNCTNRIAIDTDMYTPMHMYILHYVHIICINVHICTYVYILFTARTLIHLLNNRYNMIIL